MSPAKASFAKVPRLSKRKEYMNREGEGSRVHELISEFEELQGYLDQALKDKDFVKLKEIQEQRKKLSEEIRAIDPEFDQEDIAA